MKFEKKLILILKIVISSYRICYNKFRKKTEITNSSIIYGTKLLKQKEHFLIRYLGFKIVKTDFKKFVGTGFLILVVICKLRSI